MKLRVSEDSIRLRLGRGEVARAGEGQSVEQRAHLLPMPLVYVLSSSPDSAGPSVSFTNGTLQVILPLAIVRNWAQSEQVGISADLPTACGGSLKLLIEKDFKCLHGEDEDQRDTFPNPMVPADN